MKSRDLGGKEKGRFPTPSAALLAAARVIAAKAEPAKPAEAAAVLPPHPIPNDQVNLGVCDCVVPCDCPRRVCHKCHRLKRRV